MILFEFFNKNKKTELEKKISSLFSDNFDNLNENKKEEILKLAAKDFSKKFSKTIEVLASE